MMNKDNSFSFLRPRIINLIITLVVVVSFMPVISYDTGIRCVTVPCDSFDYTSLLGYFLFHSDKLVYGVSWIFLIVDAIGSYVIVSVIGSSTWSKKN